MLQEPASVVYWEQDEKIEGLWWWWTPENGWGRYIDKEENEYPSGGWAVKTCALVHMYHNKQWDALEWALKRLYSHHSLQGPLRKLNKAFKKDGDDVYLKYI